MPKRVTLWKNEAVSVAATGNTTLLELSVINTSRLMLQVTPTTNALDAFIIQGRAHPDAVYSTLASAAADYTTPNYPVLKASGDLASLAADAVGWAIINTEGLESIKVLASAAAAGTASVSIYANAN